LQLKRVSDAATRYMGTECYRGGLEAEIKPTGAS
jgi:hypothetical protein